MEAISPRVAERRGTPSRWGGLVFALKVAVLRVARRGRDWRGGVAAWPMQDAPAGCWHTHFQSGTALWQESDARERELEAGKVENLRQACARLDGVTVEAGGVFSFWRQVGKATRRRGFVVGRMLQQGCLVPAIGGGLCQLSNALYGLALASGCEIVERHAHSVRVPHAPEQDATVAWNYVDLRFRVPQRMRLEARVTAAELVVGFQFEQAPVRPLLQVLAGAEESTGGVQSCATCGEEACFRHAGRQRERASK